MQVIENPLMHVFGILIFAVGLTAITYIAIILYLDLEQVHEPVALPPRKK
jgi:hypothetical protein